MFLEKWIPTAHAQFTQQVKTTAAKGEGVAVEGAQTGLEDLVKFVASNIDNWIAGIIIVGISWVIAKMTAGAIKREIVKKKGEDVQESVLILVERMTTIVILTVGITIAAAINGLNFTAVIGAMSLGIGFALKDVIGNFISGIIMLSQDRIRIGDLIKIGDVVGTIVSIDTRATILQSIDGTEVVIPNQSMLNETVVSFTTNPFRRIELIVGVDYNTDLPMVTSLIKGILDKDNEVVPKPEPNILVDEFGDSSINIRIYFWLESSKNWRMVRSNVANRIKKTFNELGVNIPFPIRTLKLDEDDRSFLKTMDSMKKGLVPELIPVPTRDQVMEAALGTENAPMVPEEIFENSQPAAQPEPTPQPEAAPAEPTEAASEGQEPQQPEEAPAPQLEPEPIHAAAPAEPAEATSEGQEAPAEPAAEEKPAEEAAPAPQPEPKPKKSAPLPPPTKME